MNPTKMLITVVCAGFSAGCATVAPTELVDARAGYDRASHGAAAEVAPAELHVANEALAVAETSFVEDGDSYRTRDLAYVAHRKAQLAEATASIALAQGRQEHARGEFEDTQGEIVANTKADLNRTRSDLDATRTDLNSTRTDLAKSERTGALTKQELAQEQAARKAADARAAAAITALGKLAAVKEEPRGMVITLSGSVLFASNKDVLLPEARTRLNQVADALLATRERNVVVEGHTDSRGSNEHNVALSQRRADAVRTYLVGRGYEADLITADGKGETRPVGDNTSAEGRANNRRVELVIEHEKVSRR